MLSVPKFSPSANEAPDVDESVLDGLRDACQAQRCCVCVHQKANGTLAYVALPSTALHKAQEPELRDYRLGSKIEGIASQLKIALLPDESADSGSTTATAEALSWTKKSTAAWVGQLKDVLTFGRSSGEKSDIQSQEPSADPPAPDNLLQDLVQATREKISVRRALLVTEGMHIRIRKQRLMITKIRGQNHESITCGLAVGATEILPAFGDPGEFRKIHICPFLDTIPQHYEIDLFRDALNPFFAKHPLAQFAEGDTFKYNSVEFKVVSTKPGSLPFRIPLDRALTCTMEELPSVIPPNTRKRRVGPSTSVCLGYPILPHWIDLLSPAQQHVVMSLPAPLQSLMLITYVSESNPADIERVITATEAIGKPRLTPAARAEQLAKTVANLRVDVSKSLQEDGMCIICLDNITPEDEVVKLECQHIFHSKCLVHWLVRTKTCPLCKAELTNVGLGGVGE